MIHLSKGLWSKETLFQKEGCLKEVVFEKIGPKRLLSKEAFSSEKPVQNPFYLIGNLNIDLLLAEEKIM